MIECLFELLWVLLLVLLLLEWGIINKKTKKENEIIQEAGDFIFPRVGTLVSQGWGLYFPKGGEHILFSPGWGLYFPQAGEWETAPKTWQFPPGIVFPRLGTLFSRLGTLFSPRWGL